MQYEPESRERQGQPDAKLYAAQKTEPAVARYYEPVVRDKTNSAMQYEPESLERQGKPDAKQIAAQKVEPIVNRQYEPVVREKNNSAKQYEPESQERQEQPVVEQVAALKVDSPDFNGDNSEDNFTDEDDEVLFGASLDRRDDDVPDKIKKVESLTD